MGRVDAELVRPLCLWVVNIFFSVLLCGKAVDQPVPGGVRGRPHAGADHGGPVGHGTVGWRGDAPAAHRHLLPVSQASF